MQEHSRIAAKRQLSRQKPIQYHPQAIDVASAVDPVGLAARLFGAHVSGCAQDLAVHRDGDFPGITLGQTEIHEFW